MKPQAQKILSPQEQEKRARRRRAAALVIIIILAAVSFSFGKYFEFMQPDPFDGGAYAYSAYHILNGAKIGVDEKPSAQLGTLLVNMLGVRIFGFNEVGAEIVQSLLQIAALVLMFLAMKKLFGTLPAAVGVIVASVYLSAPVIAKFGNVKEQYMIACMVIGISCFVLYQLGGRWPLAVLTGAFLSWAPLFKPTGVSAAGAIGLFVILQPIFRSRTLKQTGVDILLLLAGFVIAIAPLYIWILAWNVQIELPYSFVWQELGKMLPSGAAEQKAKPVTDYVSGSRKLVPLSKQWPMVLRYYGVLILPIVLAIGAIIARVTRLIWQAVSKSKSNVKSYDRFVLLLAVWWILDMAFVWISPHSYEQYYLPLNASAAMTGGYLIAIYCDKVKFVANKTGWIILGIFGLFLMIALSWHIFFGLEKSPHSGRSYEERSRGYLQKYKEISRNPDYPWQSVGEYIRTNSQPADKIYVWGWVPGIYVKAQRLSSASRAFTSTMHIKTPDELAEIVTGLLAEFERQPPKFIVDTHNVHFPYDGRPPLELWPILEQQIVKKANLKAANTDDAYAEWLTKNFGADEAGRFRAMKPFREYVMNNYKIAKFFGQMVVFELKNPPVGKESQ
ncbi:MAG: hypothetical protein A2167_04735 [Planctomycetes bacterium RBG_13_46_10]|nr:MAG: hypothetical protein A2167_04735 [Planctomycetes bacterium RBG_13_46_10]